VLELSYYFVQEGITNENNEADIKGDSIPEIQLSA